MYRFLLKLIAPLMLAVLAADTRETSAQTAWYEGFEGPQVSWREIGGDAQYCISSHRRTQKEAHTGDGCEEVVLVGQGGTHVYLGHEVGQPRVIGEMMPTVWVKADRPGIQLLARIVLPRTLDPRDGRPVTTLVQGASYGKVHHWQQLRIQDVPRLLARQVRLLRMELGPQVDAREAFVDRILLNVYGGPGVTRVWIDDLDIAGFVGPPSSEFTRGGPIRLVTGEQSQGATPAPEITLVGSVLRVDQTPIFPRLVQYQGEPLSYLKELGFNGVWLDRPPPFALLKEAEQSGLWLVCPPPFPPREDKADTAAPRGEIGPVYNPVLAWDLGWGLAGEEVQTTRRWASQTRAADGQRGRPLLCRPDADLRSYSRHVDILLLGRSPLGSSLELTDYGTWLRQRPRLARPGTPSWSTIQTQPAASLEAQWNISGRGQSLPPFCSAEQIRLLVYTSVAAGSRGLLFESREPLNTSDPAARRRALTLELLNLELELIQPWLAAGNLVATVEATEPEVVGAVMQTDRTRLVVPIWVGRGAQFVPGQAATGTVSFVIPGVPESCSAYLLEPGGLRPLRHQRVTGGTQVSVEEFSLSSMVVLTQDPLAIHGLTQRIASAGRRLATLRGELAAMKLQTVEQADAGLANRPGGALPTGETLNLARGNLQWSKSFLARGDTRSACLHAERAMRQLRVLQREAWEKAVASMGSPVASPATSCFATLPWHWALWDRIRGQRPGANRLPQGNFEDLQAMISAGWGHFHYPSPQILAKAHLAGVAAHSGHAGVRLAALPAQPESPPFLVETPPVWITSPPVPVEAGALVRIQGWVQVPEAITGSVDGLLIVDSLAGEPLGARFGKTEGWQPLTLYRLAPRSGTMTVSFVLSGLGEAWIDDVAIEVLEAGAGTISQGTSATAGNARNAQSWRATR